MQHIIFTRGMQASGKSTWAKKFVEENQNYKRVNRDSFRHMLSNYTFNSENEELVTTLEYAAIYSVLAKNYNLVIDNMNLDRKYIDNYKEKIMTTFPNTEFEFEEKEFPISLAEAIERDKNRPDSLGKNVLKRTWEKYEIELKQMIERSKPKIEFDSDLPTCVICDIDGTLSLSPNRKIYDNSMVHTDIVVEQVKEILEYFSRDLTVFVFSGRKDSCREETIRWLNTNNIMYDKLHMRKSDDDRPDTIVKKEMYDAVIKDKYNVKFVIDDRPCVLEMWNSLGLFTLNVNQDPMCKNNF